MQSRKKQFLWVILFPLSCVWACVTLLRRRFYPEFKKYRPSLQIVCVGNIHSGGSGKTPLVKALAEHFSDRSPVVLSRGYRGVLSAVGAKVQLNQLNGPKMYGDEPWMLAHQINAPVFISKKRVLGIKKIQELHDHSLVILDDGFQHLSLGRTVDLVCINTDKNPEENFCLPLGELREPVSALFAAGAVVLTPASSVAGLKMWQSFISENFPNLPWFVAETQFEGFYQGEKKVEVSSLKSWVSFCGVASPERFIAACKAHNPKTEHFRSFPDHYDYQESDIDKILKAPCSQGVTTFVTTEKDWYKVSENFKRAKKELVTLRYGYKLPDPFWAWMETRLQEL